MTVKPYTAQWKLMNSKICFSPALVIQHIALKAWFAKAGNTGNRDSIFKALLSRAFTPITNKNKLANGCTPWSALEKALIACTRYPIDRYISKQIGFFGLNFEDTIKMFGSNEKYVDFLQFLYSQRKSNRDYTRRNYSYIFIDQDNVEPIYQAVQAAHVAMVIGQKMDKRFDANTVHYQICKKPEQLTINQFAELIEKSGFTVEKFYEPDVDRTIAIGTHPIPSHKRGSLTKYELLNFGS